jgi:hypothetical protein
VLQVRAHRLSVRGVLQDAFEVRDDARTICVEDVLHPVERLSDIVEQQAADFSVTLIRLRAHPRQALVIPT